MQKTQIRKMTPSDFGFAIRLTDTMNWDLTEKDFRFMTRLEPEGCFTMLDGAKKVGMITTAHFGPIGWIGNVIVEMRYRSKGFGALLVKHAIDYLRKKSVTTIGLYAYLDTVPFYEKLGFKADLNFIRLARQSSVANWRVASVRGMTERDLKDVVHFDEQCMGWNRGRLLKRIFTDSEDLCYVALDDSGLLGFIMGDWYRQEIGPCMSRVGTAKSVISLFKAALSRLSGVEVRTGVSESQQDLVKALRKMGFQEEFKVVRMYLGEVPDEAGCVWAMESLERG